MHGHDQRPRLASIFHLQTLIQKAISTHSFPFPGIFHGIPQCGETGLHRLQLSRQAGIETIYAGFQVKKKALNGCTSRQDRAGRHAGSGKGNTALLDPVTAPPALNAAAPCWPPAMAIIPLFRFGRSGTDRARTVIDRRLRRTACILIIVTTET